MKLFRISNILLLCVAVGLGALLFRTSQSVQGAEDRLAGINRDIRQERESIRVLDAEWDYLNRPQRLEELADKYLKVAPPQSGQFIEDVAAVPVPAPAAPSVVPSIVPAAKPAYARPVAVPAQPAPVRTVPSDYIKASEKQSFEALIKQKVGEE